MEKTIAEGKTTEDAQQVSQVVAKEAIHPKFQEKFTD
jgi:hypothetical protein